MARLTFLDVLYAQLSSVPPLVTKDLTEKTIIITGANTGLGLEACKHFARMNPGRLILGCRNKVKGEQAISNIKRETGYERAELWLIDLLEFSSVKEFADKFERDGGRLDYLVLNAGIVSTAEREETNDGWEHVLQVNYLSSSLLALRLLPRMAQTAPEHSTTPRLVLVSSGVHYWTSLEDKVVNSDEPLHVLNDEKDCTSKLLAYTTEEGSRQLVWGALGGSDQELSGAYISRSAVAEPSDFIIGDKGKKVQERLWRETLGILGKIDPKVVEVIENYLTQ
ncbi:hypothetical protein AMATHDRAFT_5644 [Amanita thiersii Skay4041]|uniref:Ketoreductase (KR) domain-containing protein n=1 Tax=Amanita thiersii Skay4041 TaxID=703135 RepID=A0A2A9NC68_9AGAR|nr:hypothetical protein AMATHDRAFT_5644 [Amanita thiersii Skay4041]